MVAAIRRAPGLSAAAAVALLFRDRALRAVSTPSALAEPWGRATRVALAAGTRRPG